MANELFEWAGKSPATKAWDFTALALGVVGADRLVNRAMVSADGWTREIDLTVGVSDPYNWQGLSERVAEMLSFLTGDFWNLTFVEGGYHPAPPKRPAIARPETCVALLSGGLDSLIGAIDMEAAGNDVPVYVSNRVRGDVETRQKAFPVALGATGRVLSLNADPRTPGMSAEISQRPRPIVFIAFGILAATLLDRYKDNEPVDLHTPENGFISLNVPLTTARRGSLSTRTTHPRFIQMLQHLLDELGISVRLRNRYQFKTKGVMMAECRDQQTLMRLAAASMSCGRAGRSYTHCGRCLPCLVRRSSFLKWRGRLDADTTIYVHPNVDLRVQGRINSEFHGKAFAEYDDVMQTLTALDYVKRHGARRWIGPAIGSMSFGGQADDYRRTAEDGLLEIGEFLEVTGLR
ncbi:Qat anti-phage system QueC-like protein QatC [Neorhizobium sp. P12A]|uniref:Qat anti-phage system QueC-like protein QatC n=1 Tax=Neorhizobium sp. P12A TaxID=2268027 RepID=UPI001FF0073D|nr:Qat anti-phage system QueC-like protein QatC [Neorhizobium sp. P12A]